MASRFIKKTHKAKRPIDQRKIRWKRLGLAGPSTDEPAAIEEIGEQVAALASRGLAQGARRRPALPKGSPSNIADRCGTVRRSRRGATEQWTRCRPRPSFTGGIS